MKDEKDIIIALQRKKIEELSKKISALKQENALLSFENFAKKKPVRKPHL